MGMLRQTKKPAMIALSFGLFTISSRRRLARCASKLPTALTRDQNDARTAMQPLDDNEPDRAMIAKEQGSVTRIDGQYLEPRGRRRCARSHGWCTNSTGFLPELRPAARTLFALAESVYRRQH